MAAVILNNGLAQPLTEISAPQSKAAPMFGFQDAND
jgi:hypothetical protein